jgi:hypothetical protein
MKIERLLFKVNPPDMVKDFLLADAEVWNPWLKRQKGFINKTQRIVSRGIVELVIFWTSESDLKRAGEKKDEMRVIDKLLEGRSPARYTLLKSY